MTLTIESRPVVTSMAKKMTAQNGANGILARASGYAMKAKPGPAGKKMSPILHLDLITLRWPLNVNDNESYFALINICSNLSPWGPIV